MEVKVLRQFCNSYTIEIKEYVRTKLDGGSFDVIGAVEEAGKTAENGNEALGRLCDILVSRGIISLDDVAIVAGGEVETDQLVEPDHAE